MRHHPQRAGLAHLDLPGRSRRRRRGAAGWDDIRTVVFIQESSRAQLAELARLVDEGQLRPQVGAVYPLAEAVAAYTAKAAGGVPGRVVLRP